MDARRQRRDRDLARQSRAARTCGDQVDPELCRASRCACGGTGDGRGAGLGTAVRAGASAIWARGCCRCARRPISISCRSAFRACARAIFRAGLELSYSASWRFGALSLPVRAGWLKKPGAARRAVARRGRVLSPARQRLRRHAGRGRRASTATARVCRSTWTLIAEAGDGPQIPALPALCVIHGVARRHACRNAARCRASGCSISRRSRRQFKRFAIHTSARRRHSSERRCFSACLPGSTRMPAAVRDGACAGSGVRSRGPRRHRRRRDLAWRGLIARVFGFPASGRDLPASVTIEREGDGEIWIRRFGDGDVREPPQRGREAPTACANASVADRVRSRRARRAGGLSTCRSAARACSAMPLPRAARAQHAAPARRSTSTGAIASTC